MSVKIDLTDIEFTDKKLNTDGISDGLVDELYLSQPDLVMPSVDNDTFPVLHIMSVDSLNSSILLHYISRLPEIPFSAHLSVNLSGKPLRLVYSEGELVKGLDKNGIECEKLEAYQSLSDISGLEYAEIRGMMCGENFIAYDFVGENVEFDTKQELYDYLEEMGFEVPLYWVIDDLTKVTLRTELIGIVNDCEIELTADDEQEISGYSYPTNGLIFTLNDIEKNKEIGTYNGFDMSAVALHIGTDKLYTGIIQTIYWKPYKDSLKPFALVAEDIDVIDTDAYILSLDDIENFENLGIETEDDLVIEVPLYNASNLIKLDAYVGNPIYFKEQYGLIYPCYSDGMLVTK